MSHESELLTIQKSLFALERYCKVMNLNTIDLDVLSEEAEEIESNLGTELGALAQHNLSMLRSLDAEQNDGADIELMNMLLTLQNIRGEFDNCINYIEQIVKERPINLDSSTGDD